ncbi:MAG: metallophosphoesterase [Lachnospiraceae bacterium]|nr:metallophosphoesterase [Lachnospiraceae bacterium]
MILLKVLVICILVLAVVCLVSIWQASTHFHKVYYRLSSDKISKPVKFVLLTDLHDKTYGPGNARLLQAICEEQPDGILIAGDMLTARTLEEGGYTEVSLALISKLTEQYPVYYGLGNHEAKMSWSRKSFGQQFEQYMKALKDTGAVVLRNQFCELQEMPVRIYGLDMERMYYKRLEQNPMQEDYLLQKLGQADKEYYNILLAHNPTYFDQYALWKPDLVLSGHVHGGLVKLPLLGGVISPALKLFPKYDGGKFTKNGATMILSRGLGFHSVGFRMWNPCELVVLEIIPSEKA